MNETKKTIILGAGLTGLSCAYHLKKNYQIFEKELFPGGLCRSIKTGGFTFDITGHLLHLHDPYVEKLVRSFLKRNITTITRKAWIFSKNSYTRYPFQAHTYGLPKKVAQQCLADYFAAQAKLKRFKKPPPSFHDWIIRNFGAGIAKHFMIPYNEKLWCTSLHDLTTDWIQQFIPQPSVDEVLRGSLTDEDTTLGYNTTFLYPKKGGIQTLINAFLARVESPLIKSEAVRIRWYDKRIEIAGKGPIMYDRLVSTMPLPQLIHCIHRVPADIIDAARSLRWVSVLNINLGLQRPSFTDRNWIYFPEKDFPFYRVGFFSNLSKNLAPPGTTSLYIEIAHLPDKKPVLKKVLADTIKGLKRADILRHEDKVLKINVIPIPCAYVVYDKNYRTAVEKIQTFLQSHGIISTGRYGGWKYSYMEEAILDGKKAAEQIMRGV